MARVIIRHPRTEHEVGIESGDFRRRKLAQDKDGNPISYEEAGYRIVSYADGQPYQQPAAPKTGEHAP
jgi:hypothetical protein